MKITIHANRLLEEIEDLKAILDSKETDAVQIQAGGNIQAEPRVVIRSASGGDFAELRLCGASIHEEGCATFNIRELAQAAFVYKREKICVGGSGAMSHVSFADEQIMIAAPDYNFAVGEMEGERASFDSADFRAVVDAVRHAQSEDYACRRSLCGVHLEMGQDMKLVGVATDGRTLATTSRQISRAELPHPAFEAFLPRCACEFICRAWNLHNTMTTVITAPNKARAGLIHDGCVCYFNTPETSFPEWRKVIPADSQPLATFSSIMAIGVIERAVYALQRKETEEPDEDDPDGIPEVNDVPLIARLERAKGSEYMEVSVAEHGLDITTKFTSRIKCEGLAEFAFAVLFNARFLLRMLERTEGKIEMSGVSLHNSGGEFGPFVFKCPEKPDFYELIMPFREY